MTAIPPSPSPKIALLTMKLARLVHSTTSKMRVSVSSRSRVAAEMTKMAGKTPSAGGSGRSGRGAVRAPVASWRTRGPGVGVSRRVDIVARSMPGPSRVDKGRRRRLYFEPAMVHHLDAGQVQYEWNNAIPPRLEIEPGDTVVFETRDAADRYYSRASTHADVLARGPFRGHPLTGPVRVRGARPGDVLVVEILEVKPADFGWTAIRPGRGLLPEADFAKPYLQIWNLADGTHARAGKRLAVPLDPFPGVMGTALDLPGGHSTMPPRKNGGNMHIKHPPPATPPYPPRPLAPPLFSVAAPPRLRAPP